MLPQIFFRRGLFWNLFGREFYSKFVWLRVSLHRLFGGEFFFRYIWVEFYLQLFLGREFEMFHQVLYLWWIFSFFVVVYFENCFVQTSLQRVSGKHVSSIFLVTDFY